MTRAIRYLLIPILAVVAVSAMLSAMVGVWRLSRPALALSISGADGVASMRQAELVLTGASDPTAAVLDLVPSARAALRDTPLNAAALSLLATAAFADDRRAEGLRILGFSQRVSRRDLRAHLILIENAVAIGDVDTALKYYDLALSTNDQAGELLYPVLTRAIATPQVRDGLVRYVRRDPSWLRAFLVVSLAGSGNPSDLSLLVRRAGGLPLHRDYRDFETQILWSLVRRGNFDEARAYFLSLPGTKDASLRSVGINRASADRHFGPMAWYFVDRPELSAAIEEDNRLWVRVAAGQNGMVAQKLLYLPAGRYRFTARVHSSDDGAPGTLQLWCGAAGASRLLWETRFVRGATGGIAAEWQISTDCRTQTLMLNASSGDTQADAELRLSDLKLVPSP